VKASLFSALFFNSWKSKRGIFLLTETPNMDLAYFPMDDRPCCTLFPSLLAQLAGISFKLVRSKAELKEVLLTFPIVILSIEGFVFGSLVESRQPNLPFEKARGAMDVLEELLRQSKGKVFGHTVLMRQAPSAFSREELEMAEKVKMASMHALDEKRLPLFLKEIPLEIWEGYLLARKRNLEINQRAIHFVENRLIHFFAISLDDLTPIGLNQEEQKLLELEIKEKKLENRVVMLPGTDETGLLLMARALLEEACLAPRIFVHYSHPSFDSFQLRYEDRPLSQLVGLQLRLLGVRFAESSQDADVLLFVHTPQETQLDVPLQSRFACDSNWLTSLQEALKKQDKLVVLADVRYANGADAALLRWLSKEANLAGLASFSGWNTASNALGIALSHGVLRWLALQCKTTPTQEEAHHRFLFLRFLEDWLYQAEIRPSLLKKLQEKQISPLRLPEEHLLWLKQKIKERLQDEAKRYLAPFAPNLGVTDVNFPWSRLFEIVPEFQI
jgi:hypothetical protein